MKKINTIIKIKDILLKNKRENSYPSPVKNIHKTKSFSNENNDEIIYNSIIESINDINVCSKKRANKDIKKSNFYNFFSKVKKGNIEVLNNKYDVTSRLTKIMMDEGSSYEYINSVLLIFEKFFNYIITKENKNNTKTKIYRNKDNNFIVKYIELEDVYEFLQNKKINNYSNSSLNNILSKMRKFIRILNNRENINYKNKLAKIEIKDVGFKLSVDDIKIICEEIKAKYNLQLLLIFYFLYFIGLTFSKTSRIKITDLKSDFSILVEKKEKYKKYIIPNIIRHLLLHFIKSKNNDSLYLFYDSIKDGKNITRTQLIKNNMTNIIQGCKSFSKIKSSQILQSFAKNRKTKRLNKNLFYLFDINFNIKDIKELKENNFNLGINDSDNKLYSKSDELSDNNISNYSLSKLTNNNLISLDESQEKNNDISSYIPSPNFELSLEKSKEIDIAKHLDFENNEKNLILRKNEKKKVADANFISISDDLNI